MSVPLFCMLDSSLEARHVSLHTFSYLGKVKSRKVCDAKLIEYRVGAGL